MRQVPRTRVLGPLAPFADGFRAELYRLGYTTSSREYKLGEMAQLSLWLDRRGLGACDINTARVQEFLAGLETSRKRPTTLKAMRPLLVWLRSADDIGADPAASHEPLRELMDRYRRWMAERGLADRTINRYEQGAWHFLSGRVHEGCGPIGTEGLTRDAVTTFLLQEASRGLAPASMQQLVAVLRSLLRFLYLEGLAAARLGEAVPPVPRWKDARVPARLAAAQVSALLSSCDRTTPRGMRDFAMLLLLARLGLRAAEVAGLVLDDFDWRSGELVVRGKSRRCDRMPLPADVGEAVATYVTEARPRVECRTVFLTATAPTRPLYHTGVAEMVWRQCGRAGLPQVRAHRLRHALATDLLDAGVSLPEIAQVLRQRDLATTAVYAKVDHARLRELALPWPVAR